MRNQQREVGGRRRRPGAVTALAVTAAVALAAWVGFAGGSRGSASTAMVATPPGSGAGHPAAAARPARGDRSKAGARPASPCARNTRPQLIVVSIGRQHEWACARRRTVLSTPVTTGADRPGDATPTGTFAVQGLNRNTTLTTDGAQSYRVKYWIPFHLGVWGFHDASWQRIPFGSPRYKTRGSHGCVHMPLQAICRLFHWARYGTPVRIER
ncbi:MAG TPA: L,D-transpeptidase [Mycobacteriales bacterium]|nr:L,D-transpeptidase [Mycobacteriales bacterium]